MIAPSASRTANLAAICDAAPINGIQRPHPIISQAQSSPGTQRSPSRRRVPRKSRLALSVMSERALTDERSAEVKEVVMPIPNNNQQQRQNPAPAQRRRRVRRFDSRTRRWNWVWVN